ncbi:polyketide synthase dehydratase domain-containing protein, partial [Micromonospora sp. DT201]|uniref:polyketide synthase dehydratase domain-containing protein n=1 Tax=Micromonospora sp. DT201 TaxID=3393442 RepID=UPI003CFB7AE7
QTVAQLQVTVGEPDDDGRREVAVYSRPEAADEDGGHVVTCHARGWLALQATPVRAFGAQWPPAGAEPIEVGELYARLADAGYEYGPAFQGVRVAWRVGADVYTEVALPDGYADSAGAFGLHPALFDATLHGGLEGLGGGDASLAGLPFSWSGVRIEQQGVGVLRVRIGSAGDSALRIDLADDGGRPVAGVDGLVFRPAEQLKGARRPGANALFTLDWTEVATTARSGAQRIAVLGDLAGPGERYPDLDALDSALADGHPVPNAVLVSIQTSGVAIQTTAVATELPAAGDVAVHALALVQRWLATEALATSRLVVVTRNGVAVGDEAPDLAQAPVWGLLRSAQSEHPERFVLVDLDGGEAPPWESLLGLDEAQVAVRAGRVLAPRITPTEASAVSGESAWRLSAVRKGSLEDLTIVASDADRPLGAHEVRIGVRAAGLNFR